MFGCVVGGAEGRESKAGVGWSPERGEDESRRVRVQTHRDTLSLISDLSGRLRPPQHRLGGPRKDEQ